MADEVVNEPKSTGMLNIYGGPVPLQIPRTVDEFVPINVEEDPTFGETVSATLGYQYAPLFNAIKNNLKYRDVEEVGYNPIENMQGYEEYKSHLYEAKSSQEMAELKQQIDENKERREVLYRSSIPMQFAAGIFDPINLVALPFGGPAVGLGRSFLRTGTSVAALQVGLEAVRAPFDPLATPAESVMNVGSAFVTGGMIGTLFSIPASRRAAALNKTNDEIKEFVEVTETFTVEDLAVVGSRDARKLGTEADEILDTLRTSLPKTIDGLTKSIDEIRSKIDKVTIDEGVEAGAKLQKELEVKTNAKIRDTERLQEVKREQQFRRLEGIKDGTLKDPFGLQENIFTSSWFYKGVTTPFKRIVQGKIPSSVKEYTVKLAGDGAMMFNLNKIGFATPKSVHQYSSTRNALFRPPCHYDRSIFTDISPACRCMCLSGALKPALSKISLLASSCTYSLLAPLASPTSLAAAVVAFSPNTSPTLVIMYDCTCGKRKARLAVTLPLFPSEYPALRAASVMLHPSATSVSTKAICFSVTFSTSVMLNLSCPPLCSPPNITRSALPCQLTNHTQVHAPTGHRKLSQAAHAKPTFTS